MTWDEDGWPRVGDNGRIALSMEGPNLPEAPWPTPVSRDDFDGPTLGLDWNFLRWPPATYTFSYALAEGEPRELASGEARYLATEVAGGFTGVYFALYATANGAQTTAPADFDWFEYRVS